MKIYRSIVLNDGEQIDPDNIGRSWTLDLVFAEDHAKDLNNGLLKDGWVILEAQVWESAIDMDNTLFAMECRGYEYEVVLLYNTPIEAKVVDSFGVSIPCGFEISGMTGESNFEDYCDYYYGDLSPRDFFNLVKELE